MPLKRKTYCNYHSGQQTAKMQNVLYVHPPQSGLWRDRILVFVLHVSSWENLQIPNLLWQNVINMALILPKRNCDGNVIFDVRWGPTCVLCLLLWWEAEFTHCLFNGSCWSLVCNWWELAWNCTTTHSPRPDITFFSELVKRNSSCYCSC